jgi:transposase InsO family protein
VRFGTTEILNTDQGSPFTGIAFVHQVQQHGIQLSMDGKGSWRDNVFVERLWKIVKYEEVYSGRSPDMVYFAALPNLYQSNVNPAELHLKTNLSVQPHGATALFTTSDVRGALGETASNLSASRTNAC